jgi:hypothetical protein
MDGPEKTEYTSLQQRMDSMIDAYLWFLPLPRFTYTLDKKLENPTMDSLRKGVDAAKNHWNSFSKTEINFEPQNFEDIVSFYKTYYKHIHALRDTSYSVDSHALLLILMILDPCELSTLKTSILDDHEFHEIAYDIIDEEFRDMKLLSCSNMSDLFDRVELFLSKKNELELESKQKQSLQFREHAIQNIMKHLEKPGPNYIKYSTIDPSMINDQLKSNIVTKLNEIGKGFVGTEKLEKMLWIANLVEEDPQLGFQE